MRSLFVTFCKEGKVKLLIITILGLNDSEIMKANQSSFNG
jgi:hypothetical protein